MRTFATIFLTVLFALWAEPSLGARPTGPAPGTERDAVTTSDSIVRSIQQALTELKYYNGSINGRFNAELGKAIRAYQKATSQKVDGQATKKLADRLETEGKVGALLKRLDKVRTKTIDAARQALLSRPDTRHLLEGGDDDVADPTRDATACFNDPTARCLLAEAAESAKAVFKPEMRDWALGEVLVAQARAGLSKEAMDTTRRIGDPRLVMVALRDIAKSEAQAGRNSEALAASEIIPDPLRRIEALEAIAAIQAEKKEDADLRPTVKRYLRVLAKLKDKGKQVSFRARLAVIIGRSGDDIAAAKHLAEAEKRARAISLRSQRGPALRHVASALAETGKPRQALALLKQVEDKADHTPVLVTAAAAHARSGNAEEALATAAAIDAKRYRAVVLSRIAVAQAVAGDLTAARKTVEIAYAATEEIKLPFALDFAHNQVALALLEVAAKAPKKAGNADYEDASQKAGDIKDDKLRATLLWTIADAQRRAGFVKGAEKTTKQAKTATKDIKSALSRVWMFGDMATARKRLGEKEGAWDAFKLALAVAEDVKNSWSRARALGKVATTLIELSE